MSVEEKNIALCVTGGIAAYKSALVARELIKRGANVRVLLTESATRFIGPMTFAGLTGNPPITDFWDPRYAGEVHVEIGQWADAVLVAPATMNLMGKAANGICDNVVLATMACARGKVILAPAMHYRMWEGASTQRSASLLNSAGVGFVGPAEGELASGETGIGRLEEPATIVDAVEKALSVPDFRDCHILVTAGPTHEDLDPVRYLGNRSTGRMGFAIAERAARRGADVTLVAGPVHLPTPSGVHRIDVRTAIEMQAVVKIAAADVVIMAAAVADYRPREQSPQKIKKSGDLDLQLVRNPDILAGLGKERSGPYPILVGFALETENLLQNAREKLERKKLDLIVANQHLALGSLAAAVTLIDGRGETHVPKGKKGTVADRVLDRVATLRSSI